jgi:hypothetical protein
MDAGATIFVEKGRGVDGCSELSGGTVLGFDPGMGRVLGLCRLGVQEAL